MVAIKSIAKKQEKYKVILDVSEKLMNEKGLYSLNMDEVASVANLAKGTLYLYFKSKEDIFAALALKARILLLEAFEKKVSEADNPIDRLKAIIFANFDFLKKNALYYELVSFYEINERQTETEEMAAVIGRITGLVIDLIKKGQEDGSIKNNIDPTVLSFSMWGMTVGIMQLIKVKAGIIKNLPNMSENDILLNYIKIFENGIKNNDL